ncbi:MAG: hypothetical protein EXR73_13715 [Myxococcales bacterium]|nr:hypothetical protein [Myxococcales bacterium]
MLLTLPRWVVFATAVLVLIFGAYRLFLGFRSRENEVAAVERGGLYGRPRRTQLLFGIVYLVMGTMLLLSAFGIRMLPSLP